MLGELKLVPQDWASVIDIIPTILNEAPESRLGRNVDGSTRSSLEVRTCIRPRRANVQVLSQYKDPSTPFNMDRATAERPCNIRDVQDGLRKLHKDVKSRIHARRQRSIDAHNAATIIITPHFEVGDLVLICKATRPKHKLAFRWCGLRRVVAVKRPAICVDEDLLTQKRETVHATRMRKYFGKLDGANVPEEVLNLADRTAASYEAFESIIDIEKNAEGIWLRLQWEGLVEYRDYKWILLTEMYYDIQAMVKTFLVTMEKRDTAEAVTRHLGISLCTISKHEFAHRGGVSICTQCTRQNAVQYILTL